jgi:hypothetical protein
VSADNRVCRSFSNETFKQYNCNKQLIMFYNDVTPKRLPSGLKPMSLRITSSVCDCGYSALEMNSSSHLKLLANSQISSFTFLHKISLLMIAVIIPTYAQITSLLHILAYMFRPFWVIIRALQNTTSLLHTIAYMFRPRRVETCRRVCVIKK